MKSFPKTLLIPVFVFLWMLSSSFQLSNPSQNPADVFWEALRKHCGKAYEGNLAEGMSHPTFNNQKLILHVRQCDENTIKIPLIVGEDRSRTWILTKKEGVITLKHDHRHEDGSEDAITQYGGTSTNTGFPHMQVFPADAYTAALIDYAATNIWWMTLKEDKFTYNLRRIEGNSYVSLEFNLKTPVAAPEAPWGWED